jgi:hypothetical protein
MPVCFMPHMHLLVWKSQIGSKTLVNLGAGKKLTCFDPLRKGCRIFFLIFLTTICPAHYTYNIQLTKK